MSAQERTRRVVHVEDLIEDETYLFRTRDEGTVMSTFIGWMNAPHRPLVLVTLKRGELRTFRTTDLIEIKRLISPPRSGEVG